MKTFKIIFINILLIILLWLFFSFCFFVVSLLKSNYLSYEFFQTFYSEKFKQIDYIDEYFTELNYPTFGGGISRNPAGLKYNKPPLLLLGCSYANGFRLDDEQTFTYKLSEILKRPVYNKALCQIGIQHAYYLSNQDYFYKQVPPCDTVIYIFIDDHFRRILGEGFCLFEPEIYLHYKYKNNEFIMDNYTNPVSLFLKKDYILKAVYKVINQVHLRYITNGLTDETLAYFIKIRENLENHWHKKIHFVVLIYQDPFNNSYLPLTKELIVKLQNNNFDVTETSKLLNGNVLFDDFEKYSLEDGHPNEKAWDLITPLFVEECRKRGIFK